jgi:hypothetical protein
MVDGLRVDSLNGEVQGCNGLMAIKDLMEAVVGRGAKRYGFALEGFVSALRAADQ